MSAANDWLRKVADDSLERRARSVYALNERFGLVKSVVLADDSESAESAESAGVSAEPEKQKTPSVPIDQGFRGTTGGELFPERPDPNQALRDAYRRIKSTLS